MIENFTLKRNLSFKSIFINLEKELAVSALILKLQTKMTLAVVYNSNQSINVIVFKMTFFLKYYICGNLQQDLGVLHHLIKKIFKMTNTANAWQLIFCLVLKQNNKNVNFMASLTHKLLAWIETYIVILQPPYHIYFPSMIFNLIYCFGWLHFILSQDSDYRELKQKCNKTPMINTSALLTIWVENPNILNSSPSSAKSCLITTGITFCTLRTP